MQTLSLRFGKPLIEHFYAKFDFILFQLAIVNKMTECLWRSIAICLYDATFQTNLFVYKILDICETFLSRTHRYLSKKSMLRYIYWNITEPLKVPSNRAQRLNGNRSFGSRGSITERLTSCFIQLLCLS